MAPPGRYLRPRRESFITAESVLVDMGRLQRILNAPKVKRNIEKGSELYNAGDMEGARTAFATAVELDEEHYEAQYYLALSGLKRYEEAESHFRRSITLKGDEPKSHADLGELLHNMGRKEEAEAEYQQTLRLDPANAIVIVNLGTLLRDSGRFTEASDLYRRALELPNLDPETRAKLQEIMV
jgi:protein O-GlcNAc transferase